MISIDESILGDLYLDDILLEKDHRNNLQKMGIPNNIAEYLHNFHDKYSLWFGDQFKDMPDFVNSTDKIRWVMSKRNDMQSILDWIRGAENVNIRQYSWEDALNKSHEWHESLMSSDEDVFYKDGEFIDDDGDIIKVYRDGYYWLDLETNNSRKEGNCMGHCGRSDKAETLYSLRHKDLYYKKSGMYGGESGNSYVTMAISPSDGKWFQCKGKGNQMPNEKYWPYIADILIEKEVYEYESEYNSSDDFAAEEFRSYVEDNKDTIENADEILKKIDESGLEAQAENLYNQYEFKNSDVYYQVDGDYEYEYIHANGWSGTEYTKKEMSRIKDMYHWSKKMDIEDVLNDIIIEKLNDNGGVYLPSDLVSQDYGYDDGDNLYEFELDDNYKLKFSINIRFDIAMVESHQGELSRFEDFLEGVDSIDKVFSDKESTEYLAEEIQDAFFEWLEEHLLEDEEEEEDYLTNVDIKRPFDLEGQMQFNFDESYRDFMNR